MAFASYVFDGLDDALEHVWQSTAPDADRRKWTLSFWAKTTENVNIDPEELNPYGIGFQSIFFDEEEEEPDFTFFAVSDTWVDPDEEVWPSQFYAGISPVGLELFEDPSFDTKVWHHYVVAFDSTQANEADRIKIYIDGQLVAPSLWACELNALSYFFLEDALFELGRFSEGPWFFAGKLAFFQIVSGAQLTPDAFGEESGGVWKHKPYEGSYGAWGLCLDGTGGFNDVSGNGFHFTNVGGVQLDPNDLPPHRAGSSAIYLGDTQINAIKLGSADIKAVYLGSTKIFEASG
jgi:hypothetical protein